MDSDLTAYEKKALLYFSGIKALEKNIHEKILNDYNVTGETENIIFVILFFLIVVITNSNEDVRKVVLKCKQEDMEDNNITENEIIKYINDFNKNFKWLSVIFLDINKESQNDDEKFQKLITEKFSDIILEKLNVANEDTKKLLQSELTRALMVGFEFK